MAAADAEPMLSDSEVEEADIEAIARANLAPGETLLDASSFEKVPARGVCNVPMLLKKVEELEYKVPEGAKRVPWVDTLVIDGHQPMPKGLTAKDGVKLESAFSNVAADAVKEAFRRFRVMKVPFNRPSDFYAEMLKTDKQMYLVKQRAAEEQRRIKIVDTRRKAQAAKKFSKSARSKKLEAKAAEKRNTLDDVAQWREKNKNRDNEDDQGLEDILNKSGKKGKKDLPKKSKKRLAADKKWGHGGKKRFAKSNDVASTNDMSASPWGRKKGKGKGKGGKGKGKGKGGGKVQKKLKK